MGRKRAVVAQEVDFELMPESVEAYAFFTEIMQSYWLHGFSGLTGLDHSAVIDRIKLFYSKKSARQWMLRQIEAIESGFMLAIGDNRRESDKENPPTAKQVKEIQERRAWRC